MMTHRFSAVFSKIKQFVLQHERRLSVLAFVLGFVWDSLTLTRIDRLFDNLVLLSYLSIAFGSIAVLHAHSTGKLQRDIFKRLAVVLRFLLPFAFGGLFSSFLIFYSQSGPIIASAPFFVILALLFFGNEFFRKHYERFVFQLSIFFVSLFFYVALIVPVLLRRVGDLIFIMSGLLTLLIFRLAFLFLRRIAPEETAQSRRVIIPVVVMIYIAVNFLYFNNMIPPIPLSLEHIGVYHKVERISGGRYDTEFEPPAWYALGRETSSRFHRVAGEQVFVMSSVYAPAKLTTDIIHEWSYYDEEAEAWVTTNLIRFPISGGREEGFRGFSFKESIAPGKWRVDVETPRGQVIGRISFEVIPSETPSRMVRERQ
ncbi:MAG: DUF2914 domain-containing protein [bacterium]|nr:DUF2914 domain-containing protein [bacterium]